jgi:hypothetical protein
MEPKPKMHLPKGINPEWIDKMRDFAKRMLP